MKTLRLFWLPLSNAFWKNNIFGSLCLIFKCGVSKYTKTRLLEPLELSFSLADCNSVHKYVPRTPVRVNRVP